MAPEAPPASLAAGVVPPPATRIGILPLWSIAQVRNATPTCLRLLLQAMRCAWDLVRAKAGSEKAARIAMMAITTNNSIRVKAAFCLRMFFISGASFDLYSGSRKRQKNWPNPVAFMISSEVSGFQMPDKTVAVELLKVPPYIGAVQSSVDW